MSEHDASRREFLVRAAVGAGAVAGAGLVPEAIARIASKWKAEPPLPDAQHPSGREHGAFFNHADAATIAAFTERLMPGAPGQAGSARSRRAQLHRSRARRRLLRAAGISTGTAWRSWTRIADKTKKKPFVHLTPAKQDEVIARARRRQGHRICLAHGAGIFQHLANAHDGRHVRRSALRRQQGFRRLAAGGIPRRAGDFYRPTDMESTAGVHALAHRRACRSKWPKGPTRRG